MNRERQLLPNGPRGQAASTAITAQIAGALRRPQTYGLLAAVAGLALLMHHAYSGQYADVDLAYPWRGAQIWLAGVDPYSAEGTYRLMGTRSATVSGFPYPFTVILLVLPLTLVSLAWAATLWALGSLAAALALPLTLLSRPPAWIVVMPLLYFPLLAALEEAQWGPVLLACALAAIVWFRAGRYLAAGAVLPLVLLKPQVGAALLLAVLAYALLLGAPRRWWAGLALGVGLWWAAPLLVMPSWPIGWLAQLGRYSGEGQNSVLALSAPGAALALAGLVAAARALRRRDAELLLGAVLLTAMLMLPMRSVYNESVLLLPLVLLAGRMPRAALAVALLSWAIFALLGLGLGQDGGRAIALYAPLAVLLLAAPAGAADLASPPASAAEGASRRRFERHRVQ